MIWSENANPLDQAVLRNLADFISTPTPHWWNKSLRKDHWLLPSQFSSQKNQGKPTLWVHLHLNWRKNTKCLFNSKLTIADYLIFPVFCSQPLTCQTGIINCFHGSPLTFKATSAGAHYHQDHTPASSRAKPKAPFLGRWALLHWHCFPHNIYPHSTHTRKNENVTLAQE